MNILFRCFSLTRPYRLFNNLIYFNHFKSSHYLISTASYCIHTVNSKKKNLNSFFVSRLFSSANNNDDSVLNNETALIEHGDFEPTPSTINVPDVWPNVPIISINRYPLFPGFIKKVDIVQDEALKELLRRKVKCKQPYVGVFVKKNDENRSETVFSISELYTVGSFAQIVEMRDVGSVVELILNAHRRIRILEPIIETDTPHISKINERRTGHLLINDLNKKRKEKEEKVLPSNDGVNQSLESSKIIYAKTENIITDALEKTVEVKALMQAIIQAIRDIVSYSQFFGQQISLLLHPSQNVIDNPVYLCDLVATLVHSGETEDLQNMMEETSIQKRLQLALVLLEKEKTIAKLKHQIGKDVEKKVQDQHRRYLLGEQLKAIKKELGIEKDEKQTIIDKLEERLKELQVPEQTMKVIKEEQTKLGFLDPHSSEFSVARNYLEWLTNIPWGKTTEENLNLKTASKILNEDHYGMKDVKDRILEFIAVGVLKKKVTGKILCFYGPPGVGKTSIAKSIARALNRNYFRFSVGGMTDVAEIKGHRRTYIGAMPGKVIQCLKKVGSENPLILIDEVDKIGGAGFHGDPASALLELLDPEQNANFMDHFLDVPVDLSKVLFICTANVLDTIPNALADRMEMIEVSGYVAEEKIKIAENYLIPQCREACSLSDEMLKIENKTIESIIKYYCRESGVRNLQKHLEKIFRKAAFIIAGKNENEKLLENKNDNNDEVLTIPITVNDQNLIKFLGREKFTTDRMYDQTPKGVIMGLAWTSMGGSALYIESSLSKKLKPKPQNHSEFNNNHAETGSLEATGMLGDVMKESIRTAYTVAKNILVERFNDNDFLETAHIHVHVPEGATPKDGPSAGCTIVSALISLALNQPAIQNVAMTGEISLTGKILPVGGIREKIIAGKRAGVLTIIIPAENKKDFDELPDFIKKGVNIYFVSHYNEIFNLIFPKIKN